MSLKIIAAILLAAGVLAIWPCNGVATEPDAKQADFYVARDGNDHWSGRLPQANDAKTDGPFATLECAREALRKASPNRAKKVLIRGGSYFHAQTFSLEGEDSGTPQHRAAWQAAPGEEVRLVGGRAIPADAFHPVRDAGVLARLAPSARDRVLAANLKTLEIPVPESFPTKFHGPSPAAELFCNDQRMTLARWPNQSWATIAKIIDPGARPRDGDNSGRLPVFEYSGDQPARWDVAAGVWLHGYWCYDWYDEVIRVKDVDRARRRITLAAPSIYGLQQGNPSPRRFRAINLLEELDQPGEYYIDGAAGVLYFWPPTDVRKARVVLAALKTPVVALNDASYVDLRGFIIEDAQGDGLSVRGGKADHIEACVVRNVRQMGIRVEGGRSHRVAACDIHDTGTGGLLLAGGDRKTLTPAHHEAINNHIRRFSQHQFTSAYAIQFEGVGNRAAHNLLHDAPHQAVLVGGNDHVFEYNIVHDVCTETDDCGALYKGRNPSCRGNVIRYNYWHHIGSPMGHGNAAVYFDDGDGGDTVFGNVFYRCGEPGKGSFGTVFSHGGHDILAENNIFVDCKRAFGSAPWDDHRWRRALDGGEDCQWRVRLREEVDITKPPYTTHYPSLVGFLDFQPGKQVRVSRAVNNVMVNCAKVSGGNWQVPANENWSVDRDPGFVDAAHGDFRLKPDSEVFTRLPGFKPIPFEKIGLNRKN